MRSAGVVRALVGAAALLGAAGCDVVFGIRPGQPRPSGEGSGGDGGGGELEVAGSIDADTTWTPRRPPRLRGPVVVEAGATLTVEAGTTVLADDASLLVIKPGARILANGTREAPVVFTSAHARRRPGDWGGLLICGNARINQPDGTWAPRAPPRNLFLICGGEDDEEDSGALRYTRIEFAGRAFFGDEYMAGLELIGVGRGTSIDHVEVVQFMDDGVYVVGGAVGMKHVLVVGGEDDSFDWEYGWRGKGQFLAGLRTDSHAHESGIEGSDDGSSDSLASNPELYNVTLLGNPAANQEWAGIELDTGTRARLHNVLVADFIESGIEIVDDRTAVNASRKRIEVTHSIFANEENFEESDSSTDYDEEPWIMDPVWMNREMDDSSAAGIQGASWRSLDLSLAPGSPALSGAAAPPEDGFFDPTARFIGACGATCQDFEGWTAFPVE
ncbi:hypothetical protein AB3662_00605 [Sorangium cellulosum]|uniref:hypothetical protein n=1 Tax=Sorangium cellulosum TaxID=56 RepID=UPI003D9A9137